MIASAEFSLPVSVNDGDVFFRAVAHVDSAIVITSPSERIVYIPRGKPIEQRKLLTRGKCYNRQSPWKNKISFVLEEIHSGSNDEIAEYLHEFEPGRSFNEIETYVTWYISEMTSDNELITDRRNDEVIFSLPQLELEE